MDIEPTRRRALAGILFGTAGSTLGATAAAHAETRAPATAADQQPGSCRLLPQAVEGPYYFDPHLVRSDMTEGRPGLSLDLVLRVIDAVTCKPLANARVDVWHCDARGVYSGYAGQGDKRDVSEKGSTYLRATQICGADGSVRFRTIYPGWYPGRTPHIHVMVFIDQTTVATAQVYFPDDVSARVYAANAPYAARPTPDTTNANDGIFRDGERDGGGIILAIATEPSGMVAALLVAVDRSGKAARKGGWWGFWRR